MREGTAARITAVPLSCSAVIPLDNGRAKAPARRVFGAQWAALGTWESHAIERLDRAASDEQRHAHLDLPGRIVLTLVVWIADHGVLSPAGGILAFALEP